MPEGRGNKGGHTGTESRFLALGGHPQIHVVPEPEVGVDVPVSEVGMSVLGELDAQRLHVLEAVPVDTAGLGVNTLVADTGENASTFGQMPDAVVFHASSKANHVQIVETLEEVMLHILVTQKQVCAVPSREGQEGKYPNKTIGGLPCSRCAAARDLALLPGWSSLGGINAGRQLKHAGGQPLAVIDVIESGAGE